MFCKEVDQSIFVTETLPYSNVDKQSFSFSCAVPNTFYVLFDKFRMVLVLISGMRTTANYLEGCIFLRTVVNVFGASFCALLNLSIIFKVAEQEENVAEPDCKYKHGLSEY